MERMRNTILRVMMVCVIVIALMNCIAVCAEELSDGGTAYAVLTDAGELIFFRSNDTYSDSAGQTVTDIMGNTYTGRVYTGIETTDSIDESNSKWYDQKNQLKLSGSRMGR